MPTGTTFSPDKIAVKRTGNYPGKPVIVFLHDSFGCIELWRDFPEKLGEMTECNVLIYDRQGYGQSCPFSNPQRDNCYLEHEADILNGLLDYWEIDNAILFGHSDGGSIALITASKYPAKIAGIITEGAHIFVEDITVKGINEAVQLYQTGDLKAKLERYHGDKTEEVFRAWADTWTSNPFRTWNIEKFLPAINCPALIIQGEQDEYGTLNQVEQMAGQISGQTATLVVQGAKHTPHREVPGILLQESATFIRQLL